MTDQKRTGLGQRFKASKREMKKVTWPKKDEVITYTFTVILIAILVSLIVWGLDELFRLILGFAMR